MSRSRSFFHSAARGRRGRKKRNERDASIPSPTPPPVTTVVAAPAAREPEPEPRVEVRTSWLDLAALRGGDQPGAPDHPSLPTLSIRAHDDDASFEPEPPSSRASMVVDASEAEPASAAARGAAQPDADELPWPIERIERFTGSRWRFVATLALLTVLGLLVRERGEVRNWFAFAKRSAAAVPSPSIADEPEGPCPAEMALVERDDAPGGASPSKVRVCVDKWEASLVEITPEGDERPWSPYLPVDGHVVKAVSKPGVVPQGYVNRDEAQQACESAGKRLCHVDEWIAACEGPQKTLYPYGEAPDEEACNVHGKSPLGELFSASFKDYLWDVRVMNDPSLNALEGTVAKTGSFEKCANGWGLRDMVGNLHEWTAESNGVFRGGYYQDAHKNGDGCRYATSVHAPTYHDYSTGFRCCRDAE